VFSVKWTRPEEQPVKLVHRIKLLGAREPNNFVILVIDPPQAPLGDSKELQEEKSDPMEIEKPFTPTPSISEQQPFKTEGSSPTEEFEVPPTPKRWKKETTTEDTPVDTVELSMCHNCTHTVTWYASLIVGNIEFMFSIPTLNV